MIARQRPPSYPGAEGRRRSRLDRTRRRRHRHRHDGATGEAVRGIHPGRFLDSIALRGHRASDCAWRGRRRPRTI